MFVVVFVASVGSADVRLARMTPPSRYFATTSAGVQTPAIRWFAFAAAGVTLVAFSPYSSGTRTWPTRSTSPSDAATLAALIAAGSAALDGGEDAGCDAVGRPAAGPVASEGPGL